MYAVMILLSFAFATTGVVLLLFVIGRINHWNEIGKMIRNRFGRNVSTPWLLEMVASNSPRYRFEYRGIPCYLKMRRCQFGSKETPSIALSVDWSKQKAAWRISTAPSDKKSWFKPPEVSYGSHEFRKRFFVFGRNLDSIAETITPSVQHGILQLAAGCSATAGRFELELSRRRLKFEKVSRSCEPKDIEKFVRCCLHIYDQMVIGEVDGVDYLEHELTIIEEIRCPICCGTIEEDLVMCSSCKSPHCKDCWEYNGKCATFACSETTFVSGGHTINPVQSRTLQRS